MMENSNNNSSPVGTNPSGLTFHDFVPSMRRAGTITHWPSFERFSSTIKKANDFLTAHSTLEIVNCETVTFHLTHDGVRDFNKTDFVLYGEIHNGFVTGLRVWTQPCTDTSRTTVQQIGCFSILPSIDKDRGAATTLDHLTYEANNWLKRNPVPGRLINVQTVEMRGLRQGKVDVDASSWTQAASSNSSQPHTVLQFFRVFYLIGEPCGEEIVFMDIFPTMLKSKGLADSEAEFEPFSTVFDKATDCLATLPDKYRFLNMQTLQCRSIGGVPFRNIYSTFYQSSPFHKHYLRFLRITCAKSMKIPSSVNVSTMRCHLFEPELLQDPGKWIHLAKFESLTLLQKRIDQWVRNSGVHVVTAESVSLKTNSGAERTQGHDAMYTWNETRADSRGVEQATFEQYITCLRVYYTDGGKTAEKPVWPRTISDYRRENADDTHCVIV
ncbi:uncharacterized protein LOC129595913 [Paramacrobiotus metropolitanus]|uniref:uncharacterized protein LOC129595913 n=1 Tax=Paramacrobiotus metropolitanus TaxID=2943436 RepID=UPI00244600DA|nr:uncharacterized protein LOC129595913 [Paramacrobiotus metropolitanus]